VEHRYLIYSKMIVLVTISFSGGTIISKLIYFCRCDDGACDFNGSSTELMNNTAEMIFTRHPVHFSDTKWPARRLPRGAGYLL